jgi:hypothetical protein
MGAFCHAVAAAHETPCAARRTGASFARGPLPEERAMKGVEKKKEGKKKPQKSLKEKRAEKHAKKSGQS